MGVSVGPLAVLHAEVGRVRCRERAAHQGLAGQAGRKVFFVSALNILPKRLSQSSVM